MQAFRQISKKLLPVFIPLILGIGFNSIYFQHSHTLADGSLVSHAHPYNLPSDSSGKASHSHTSVEFILISLLTTLVFLVMAAALFASLFIAKKSQHLLLYHLLIPSDYSKIPEGRAPPVL